MNGPILPGEDLIQMRKWRANLTPFSLQCPSQLTSTASTSAKVPINFTPNITKAKVQHSTKECADYLTLSSSNPPPVCVGKQ